MSSLSDHEFAHGLLQTRQQSLNKAVEVFKEGLLELKNAAQAEFRSLELDRRNFIENASRKLETVSEYAKQQQDRLEKTLEEGLSVITQQRRYLEELVGKGDALVASSKDPNCNGLAKNSLEQYQAFERKLRQVKSHLRKLALRATADVPKCKNADEAESLAQVHVGWGVCYPDEGGSNEILVHIPLSIKLDADSIAKSKQFSDEQEFAVSQSIYEFLNSTGRLYDSLACKAHGSTIRNHLQEVHATIKTLSKHSDDAELLQKNTSEERLAFSLVMSQLASTMESSFSRIFSEGK
ncbi:hypothetical protein NliqN6_3404 [Naganishia liquefaciens]|uniref:Uncharacterized protein n=1 Tax=Naganishia liquefaciens TaxID=104408 RepID=A0A8H3TTQ2_9TREE|nr:hypothetical protein NliqN6_3404 [Naganishia liquefaciens]